MSFASRLLWFIPATVLIACPADVGDGSAIDAGDAPDSCPAPTIDEIVLSGYEAEARAFEIDNGLPDGWADWMIARKDRFAEAYVRARTDRRIRVEVRYDIAITYDPPWASEQEHLDALERMAELAYVGWDFSFSFDDPEAEFFAVIGHSGGVSYADGDTVYLVWEGIFLHEFGHLLGIQHHYCDCCGQDQCEDQFPPGEGTCIMARTAASWGPAEQFALGLGQQRHDDETYAVITDINDRYPADWP
ncbi:MAG TPA: hypothetical protein VL283_04040 [Candidatus Baltobacteraceae bacterium]|nr:hypothetical protein [Candidatus Baltobacteraceae bacterium]